MHTIDIDFDVFKQLTTLRETESVTYNDVLRRLLGLTSPSGLAVPSTNVFAPGNSGTAVGSSTPVSGSWTTKGVTFPAGTQFRASYKGESYFGQVQAGALIVDGKRFDSPSAAATAITGNPVNGWIFWECKMPGKASWQIMKSLRKGK